MERELIKSYTKEEFEVQTFCSGGPGGQHQNKTESGVRIIHKPTGLKAESREHRSQLQNKKEAFKKLAKLIILKDSQEEKFEHLRNNERVRTYTESRHEVKDHRTNMVYNYENVLFKNGFEKVINDCVKLM